MPTDKGTADRMMAGTVPAGDMRVDIGPNKFEQTSANTGPQTYALSVGQVTFIDYEQHLVTIRCDTGETLHFQPQALTQAAAGHRHFLGAMPETNDVCLIGWGQQISGRTRTPYVLGWLVPGAIAGHDWLPTQPYSPGDFGFTATDKARFEGIAQRIRHKLRHLEPGDVFGMSSKGSDVLLNESIQLMNRRGVEVHLRDQDGALVFRSNQQFHAMSGVRSYQGMVQRDAGMLPSQMFSDGTYWDSPRVVDGAGNPLQEDALGDDPIPVLGLTPADVFGRDRGGQKLSSVKAGNLDPFVFLQRGLFIGADGQALEPADSEAVYGGKPIYRVSMDGDNAVVDPSAETLTEWRIEVSHTADGTLPVTEQTDGFDSDRLPSSVPTDAAPLGGSENAPFLEFVMGSVIGNDPFNPQGRAQYGIPLRPVVFDGQERVPKMDTGLGFPMESHAAFMLRLSPPLTTTAIPSFWSMTKDGRSFKSIVGPGGTWSAEESYSSGIKWGSGSTSQGESFRFDADGAIVLRAVRGDNQSNYGVNISSDQGAVRIYGGGSTTVGRTLSASAPVGEGERGLPSLILEAATNMHLNAAKTMKISATQLDLRNIGSLLMSGNSGVEIRSGDKVSIDPDTYELTCMGKATETYSGPKNSLPTNMPVKKTTIIANPATGNPGGPTDVYLMVYGDKVEALTAGNHVTAISVGNRLYTVGAGTITHAAGSSVMSISPGGIQGVAGSGAVTFSAPGGAVAITASAAVGITGATVALTGAVVSMPGAHLFPGGVLTDTTINPLTGLPWVASGTIGVPTVRIGA